MPKTRCNHVDCKRVLKLSEINMHCKCGLTFCRLHRQCEFHNCSETASGLALQLPKCVPIKLIKL